MMAKNLLKVSDNKYIKQILRRHSADCILIYSCFGSGDPTGTLHTCPGCPCGGLVPGATVAAAPEGAGAVAAGFAAGWFVCAGLDVAAAEPSSGAPTGTAHT